jgi:hypothetical protein
LPFGGCRHPDTGKLWGSKCPKLRRGTSWNPNHGVWQYQIELPAHADGRRRPLRRGGFANQNDAAEVLRQINEALAVCEPGDLTRVGDLIETAVNADHPIPAAADVRRRLYAAETFDTVPDVAQLLKMFMASRSKKIKPGTRRSYQGHIDKPSHPAPGQASGRQTPRRADRSHVRGDRGTQRPQPGVPGQP